MAGATSPKRPVAERWRWIGLSAAISETGVVGLAYRGDHTALGDGTIDGRGVIVLGFLVFVVPFAAASFLVVRRGAVSPWIVVFIACGAGVIFATARPGNLEGLVFVDALVAAILLLGLVAAAGTLVAHLKRTSD